MKGKVRSTALSQVNKMHSLQGSPESCPRSKCRQLAIAIYLVKFTVNKRNNRFSIWRASPGIVVLTTVVRASRLFKGFHFLVREERRVFLLLLLFSRICFFFFCCVDVNGSAWLKIRGSSECVCVILFGRPPYRSQ